MAFKKLDSAAIDLTLSRPLDAFVSQGMDANGVQAWADRGRGAGMAYGSDARPTLASAGLSCVPLSPWHISPTCTELTLKIRGLASIDGAGSTALNARLVLMAVSGVVYDNESMTPILDDASDQEVEFTFDVTSLAGEVVVPWLVFQSALNTANTASDDRHANDIESNRYKIDLGSTLAATYDDTKRWQMTFSEDSTGTAPADVYQYQGPVMIVYENGHDEVYVLPRLDRRLVAYGQFRATITELGRFLLYGWSLTETAFTAPASQANALRPGMAPRARTYSEIYRRQRALAAERTRVINVGGSPDVRDSGRMWGMAEFYKESTYLDAYVAVGGELPTYRVDTRTATLRTRRRYRALALVAGSVTSREARGFTVRLRATLEDIGGGDVATPDVQGAAIDLTPLAGAGFGTSETADRLYFTFAAATTQHLDGTWPYASVLAGTHGLRLIDASFEEQAASQTDVTRLLRLQLRGEDIEPAISNGTTEPSIILYYPACTVLIDEGF